MTREEHRLTAICAVTAAEMREYEVLQLRVILRIAGIDAIERDGQRVVAARRWDGHVTRKPDDRPCRQWTWSELEKMITPVAHRAGLSGDLNDQTMPVTRSSQEVMTDLAEREMRALLAALREIRPYGCVHSVGPLVAVIVDGDLLEGREQHATVLLGGAPLSSSENARRWELIRNCQWEWVRTGLREGSIYFDDTGVTVDFGE